MRQTNKRIAKLKGGKIMSNLIKIEQSSLTTLAVKIVGLVILAVFAGWSGELNAQSGKGAWVFVGARLDEVNTYYLKNDPCFDTKIGMPSWKSMFHYIGGKGCPVAPKNEYSQFGFQWTDPGSPLIPDSVVQMTLTATIEFDKLRPDADRGSGAITVYVSIDDKGRRNAVGDDQLLIGGGKKGDWHLPTSANKTIEWKVPRGWAKDNRLQISMQGSAPQTKQIYNYWYEWREGSSDAEVPRRPGGAQDSRLPAAGEQAKFSVGGDWMCNYGKVRLIPPVTPGNKPMSIDQSGSRLTFIDENGNRSGGRLLEDGVVHASDWQYGEKGHLGINVDGTFYWCKDAIRRFNLPERYNWNFIRWESGAICVKP